MARPLFHLPLVLAWLCGSGRYESMLFDEVADELHLLLPAAGVRREGLRAPRFGKSVKSRFGHREPRSVARFLELELDERRLLLRIVHGAIDRERMPAEREKAHRV